MKYAQAWLEFVAWVENMPLGTEYSKLELLNKIEELEDRYE